MSDGELRELRDSFLKASKHATQISKHRDAECPEYAEGVAHAYKHGAGMIDRRLAALAEGGEDARRAFGGAPRLPQADGMT